MARTTIATDDFNRASLGADYGQINTGLGGLVSINSSIRVQGQFATQPVDDKATARRITETFTDDQFASLQLLNINDDLGSDNKGGVAIRVGAGTDGSKSLYEAYVASGPAGNKTVSLVKWVSGTRTVLHSGSVAFTNNDYIELEGLGTTLTVCKNGTALGGSFTQTDSSLTTGKPGIVCGSAGTYGDNATFGNVTAGSAPVLSSPTAAPTGPTQATIGVTSDAAPTTTAISYQILAAATAAPSAAAIVGAPTGTISTGSAGALTTPITGLTTNTAVKAHFAQGATSNVVSTASFTPNTLAISGTALSAQTGTAGAAFVWTGATPESLITNTGNGAGAWSATAGVGASGVTVNSATGILVAGSLGTAGSYTITLQRADGSTVPGAQTVTKTVGLTIGGGGGGDATPPTLSAASVTGGTLSATGSVTSNEAGTLFWKMDGNATAADPGAGNEAGAGWSSQSLLASANAVNFGVQPAGLRYGHYLGVDAAGNRSTVVNASGTVSGSGATTYTAQTDIIAVSGVALASTLVYWTWSPAGRPGAFTSPVNGSSTTDSTGRATISHTVAGDGMVLIGTRPGPVVSNDRVFAQFLTLA